MREAELFTQYDTSSETGFKDLLGLVFERFELTDYLLWKEIFNLEASQVGQAYAPILLDNASAQIQQLIEFLPEGISKQQHNWGLDVLYDKKVAAETANRNEPILVLEFETDEAERARKLNFYGNMISYYRENHQTHEAKKYYHEFLGEYLGLKNYQAAAYQLQRNPEMGKALLESQLEYPDLAEFAHTLYFLSYLNDDMSLLDVTVFEPVDFAAIRTLINTEEISANCEPVGEYIAEGLFLHENLSKPTQLELFLRTLSPEQQAAMATLDQISLTQFRMMNFAVFKTSLINFSPYAGEIPIAAAPPEVATDVLAMINSAANLSSYDKDFLRIHVSRSSGINIAPVEYDLSYTDSYEIDICELADFYFQEISEDMDTRLDVNDARVCVIRDDHQTEPLILVKEKNLGVSRSGLTLKDMRINNIWVPAGTLVSVDYDFTTTGNDLSPVNPRVRVQPLSQVKSITPQRLTFYSVAPQYRAEMFAQSPVLAGGTVVKDQVQIQTAINTQIPDFINILKTYL